MTKSHIYYLFYAVRGASNSQIYETNTLQVTTWTIRRRTYGRFYRYENDNLDNRDVKRFKNNNWQ